MAVGAAAGGLSALAPDVDHAGTPASRVPGAGWVLSRVLRHQGVTHSLLACVGWWLLWSRWLGPLRHLPGWVAWAAAAGYGSHLALDAATAAGVPLLWPLPRRFGLRLTRTGSLAERLGVFPLICVLLALSVWRWG